jgi:hypothetical protein
MSAILEVNTLMEDSRVDGTTKAKSEGDDTELEFDPELDAINRQLDDV